MDALEQYMDGCLQIYMETLFVTLTLYLPSLRASTLAGVLELKYKCRQYVKKQVLSSSVRGSGQWLVVSGWRIS